MDKKLNIAFLGILLVLSLGFVYSATYTGSLDLSTDEEGAVIINSQCSPDWECTLTECVDGTQTWICNDNNQCPDASYPSNHGESQSCSTSDDTTTTTTTSSGGDGGSGGSGGGGGGGGATTTTSSGSSVTTLSDGELCTENWVCEEWSNSRKSCGVRICEDKNECGTEELKPQENLDCHGFFSFFRTTGNAVSDFSKTNTGKGIFAVILAVLILGAFMFIASKKKMKENAAAKKKGKSKRKKASKTKNIKIVKLSELTKKK